MCLIPTPNCMGRRLQETYEMFQQPVHQAQLSRLFFAETLAVSFLAENSQQQCNISVLSLINSLFRSAVYA